MPPTPQEEIQKRIKDLTSLFKKNKDGFNKIINATLASPFEKDARYKSVATSLALVKGPDGTYKSNELFTSDRKVSRKDMFVCLVRQGKHTEMESSLNRMSFKHPQDTIDSFISDIAFAFGLAGDQSTAEKYVAKSKNQQPYATYAMWKGLAIHNPSLDIQQESDEVINTGKLEGMAIRGSDFSKLGVSHNELSKKYPNAIIRGYAIGGHSNKVDEIIQQDPNNKQLHKSAIEGYAEGGHANLLRKAMDNAIKNSRDIHFIKEITKSASTICMNHGHDRLANAIRDKIKRISSQHPQHVGSSAAPVPSTSAHSDSLTPFSETSRSQQDQRPESSVAKQQSGNKRNVDEVDASHVGLLLKAARQTEQSSGRST